MDANTKEVWLVGLGIVSTLAGPVCLWFLAQRQARTAALAAEKLSAVAQTVQDVKHQTDGLTEKLGVAKLAEGEAVGKEKANALAEVRAADRAAGAAEARQIDAAAKALAPPGAPPPESKAP